MYATGSDESLNKALKAACNRTSQATCEAMILLRMKWFLEKLIRQTQEADQRSDNQERVPKMKHLVRGKTWKKEATP